MTEQDLLWLQNTTEAFMERLAIKMASAERTIAARVVDDMKLPGRSPTDDEYTQLLSADPREVARIIWRLRNG